MSEPKKVVGSSAITRKKPWVNPEMTVKKRWQNPEMTITKKGMSERTRQLVEEKQNVDGGLTAEQKKSVHSYETQKRGMKTERVAAFDKKGRKIAESKSGTGHHTALPLFRDYTDAVITHNHPKSGVPGYEERSRAIGQSFSSTDIRTAIKNNAAEMRAVTEGYTFSMRRPEGGWNADADEVRDFIDAAVERHMGGKFKRTRSGKVLESASGSEWRKRELAYMSNPTRENYKKYATFYNHLWTAGINAALREAAKKYGFIYTRKKTGRTV